MAEKPYLPEVRRQYEAYPFPARDPADERKRLVASAIDHAALVNHYCFAGKRSFSGCRVLVAGGGTGDSTIFWAEQLRDCGEVVHVDISEASVQIAQRRAKVRLLNNITWKLDSLLNVSPEVVGTFDFVNCYGVLHHLADPEAGLRRLYDLLNDCGAGGLLLYGTYGRTALYQVQELIQRFGIHELDIRDRIDQGRRLMHALPDSGWYKRGLNNRNHETFADEVFFDSYLHSQDRSYTVPELHDFINSANFRFVDYSHAKQRIMYRPETFIQDPSLLALLPEDEQERQAIAELVGGLIGRHEFYISKQPDTIASCDDLDNVPFFFPSRPAAISGEFAADVGKTIAMEWIPGVQIRFKLREHTVALLNLIDGSRSLREIYQTIGGDSEQPSTVELHAEFRPLYELFHRMDALLLRHKSVAPFLRASEMHSRTFSD